MENKPRLPLPPPLRGTDRGSFAEETIKRRLPEIARRVLTENVLTTEAATAMDRLIAEIPHEWIRPLTNPQAPDFQQWQTAIDENRKANWLETTWFFAETYFYRRIIEAVAYFESGFDPFSYQKQQGLLAETKRLASLAAAGAGDVDRWQTAVCRRFLIAALWGNQADLSLWTADMDDKPDHQDDNARLSHMLVDDSRDVAHYLDGLEAVRVDFILDNAGFELVNDLLLAHYLLATAKARTVQLHVKSHPTFVSDAIKDDVQTTITFLMGHTNHVWQQIGNRLAHFLDEGRLQTPGHLFWTSPWLGWQMPADLKETLAQSNLIISKGDANYRRAVGDAHWPYTTPYQDVLNYFPAPIIFLRTCKSDVLLGITEAQKEQLDSQEPNWDTNGRWGLIQFIP